MGAGQSLCGQNILDKIIKQYGDDALKFIIGEKAKLFIKDKFEELSHKFHECFLQFETSISELTEERSEELAIAFEGLKDKANSVLPGGIAGLERLKGESINEFSGFNSIISQVDNIKDEALNNLNVKKSHMMGKLEEQKEVMNRQIDKEKPQIPVYDQLPSPLKGELFKQAEKKFAEELTEDEEKWDQKIMKLFDAAALARMFDQMSPEGALKMLMGNGFKMLENNVFQNIGGGIGGVIGGIFN